jgi:hypothetical protein
MMPCGESESRSFGDYDIEQNVGNAPQDDRMSMTNCTAVPP